MATFNKSKPKGNNSSTQEMIPEVKIDYVCYYPKAERDTWYDECFEGVLVESIEQLRELCNVKDTTVAVDTETTGLTYYKDKVVGISFSFTSRDGYYVPLRHQYGNVPIEEAMECIRDLLYNNKVLMFNGTFDLLMLEPEGIDISKVDLFEVQALVFAADSNVKGRSLKWASEWFLGRKAPTFKQTLGTSNEYFHFGYLLPHDSVFYTVSDSANTYGVYEKLFPILSKECPFTLNLDNALTRAMYNYFIKQPIYIDQEKMKVLSESIRQRILELERFIFVKLGNTVDLECVSSDGIVDTKEYGLITLEKLGLLFMSSSNDKIHVKTPVGYYPVTDFIDVGDKQLVEVELFNGQIIHCSPDHHFLVSNNIDSKLSFKKIIDIDPNIEELVDDSIVINKDDLFNSFFDLLLLLNKFDMPIDHDIVGTNIIDNNYNNRYIMKKKSKKLSISKIMRLVKNKNKVVR